MRRAMPGVAILLLAACTSVPPPEPQVPERVDATVSEGGFTLTAVAEPASVAVDEAIEVEANLSHDGGAPIRLFGSSTGIVLFSVTRLEDGLTSGPPGVRADCREQDVPAGRGLTVPFQKSGGIPSDDPNAEFLELYFSQPELRLPAGTWRIDVETIAALDTCGGRPLELEVPLTVVVGD
jgi:hypothetical protein